MKIFQAASAGWAEVQSFVPKLWALARQLGNEIVGMMFLALAVFFLFGAHGVIETYRQLDEQPDKVIQLGLGIGAVLVLCWFGLSSFLRARHISRNG
jgi:hypothetical protein